MCTENDFIEQLLLDAEQNEIKQTNAYFDLLLIQIGKLEDEIAKTFEEQEKEITLIKEWSLIKNSRLQERIDFYLRKSEAYLKELNLKTLALPHGILQFRKKPDKVEISDLEIFLKSASHEMLKIIPEPAKPDLNNIKAYIKNKNRIPPGVQLIEGSTEFSYKLSTSNQKEN